MAASWPRELSWFCTDQPLHRWCCCSAGWWLLASVHLSSSAVWALLVLGALLLGRGSGRWLSLVQRRVARPMLLVAVLWGRGQPLRQARRSSSGSLAWDGVVQPGGGPAAAHPGRVQPRQAASQRWNPGAITARSTVWHCRLYCWCLPGLIGCGRHGQPDGGAALTAVVPW